MKKILQIFKKFNALDIEPYTNLDLQIYCDGSYNVCDNSGNEVLDSGQEIFNETSVIVKLDELYKRVSNFVEFDFQIAGYATKVTEEGVIVGCETVPFEQFDAIAVAVEQVRNKRA